MGDSVEGEAAAVTAEAAVEGEAAAVTVEPAAGSPSDSAPASGAFSGSGVSSRTCCGRSAAGSLAGGELAFGGGTGSAAHSLSGCSHSAGAFVLDLCLLRCLFCGDAAFGATSAASSEASASGFLLWFQAHAAPRDSPTAPSATNALRCFRRMGATLIRGDALLLSILRIAAILEGCSGRLSAERTRRACACC